MPFSAYTVAAVAIPTAAFTTYLYKMYMSIAPKPTLIIKETTHPTDLNQGVRHYDIVLENPPKTPIRYSHPHNACMMLHDIQYSQAPLPYNHLTESQSRIPIGTMSTPSNQKLYEACKVCDPRTVIQYQDTILGDVTLRYPWTAAKIEIK